MVSLVLEELLLMEPKLLSLNQAVLEVRSQFCAFLLILCRAFILERLHSLGQDARVEIGTTHRIFSPTCSRFEVQLQILTLFYDALRSSWYLLKELVSMWVACRRR